MKLAGAALFVTLIPTTSFAADTTVKIIAFDPEGSSIALRKETPEWTSGEEPGEDAFVPVISIDIVECGAKGAIKHFDITTPDDQTKKTRGSNWRKAEGWLVRRGFQFVTKKKVTTPMKKTGEHMTLVLPKSFRTSKTDYAAVTLTRAAHKVVATYGFHVKGEQDARHRPIREFKTGAAVPTKCEGGVTPNDACVIFKCTFESALGNADMFFSLLPREVRP